MITYAFISHNSVIEEDSVKIKCMMDNIGLNNYIIIYGGNNKKINDNHSVHLECDDTYCGLPNKINHLCKYFIRQLDTNFLVKLDRTITLKNKIPETLNLPAYCGKIIHLQNRRFHINRCNQDSNWNDTVFNGPVIKYCNGGTGYVLSREACSIIASDNSIYRQNIYEDYYIGYALLNKGIHPKSLNVKEYFIDYTNPRIFL